MDTGELGRRLVHASGAVFPAAYLMGALTWPQMRLLYVGGTIVAVVLEVLRLYVRVDWWIYRTLTREYERTNPAGYALYVVGSAAVVLAFQPRVAVPAILMLSLGDPVSGVLGSRESRAVKRPTVLAAMFGMCALIAIWFVPLVPTIVGALTAMVADGVKPIVAGYVIDDNVTIPIGAAVAIAVSLQYLPSIGV